MLVYACDDITTWTELGPLVSAHDDPLAAALAPADIWECPNLVRLGDRWVLIVSLWSVLDGTTIAQDVRYLVGDLELTGDGPRFRTTGGGLLDRGSCVLRAASAARDRTDPDLGLGARAPPTGRDRRTPAGPERSPSPATSNSSTTSSSCTPAPELSAATHPAARDLPRSPVHRHGIRHRAPAGSERRLALAPRRHRRAARRGHLDPLATAHTTQNPGRRIDRRDLRRRSHADHDSRVPNADQHLEAAPAPTSSDLGLGPRAMTNAHARRLGT